MVLVVVTLAQVVGGVLLHCDGKEKTLSGFQKETTNNQMELKAVIEGLRVLKHPCDVHITTDSNYVKDGMTKWIHNWKKNHWRTSAKKAVKNVELWQELDQLCAQHDVHWFWVKGHSGHRENDMVDELARAAIVEHSRDTQIT